MDRTLYLNENREMTIVRDGPSLWIMMGNKAGRRVPARLISRVIITGNVKLDSGVITLFTENGVPVTFLNRRGDILGTALGVVNPDWRLKERQTILFVSSVYRSRVLNWITAKRRNSQIQLLKDLACKEIELFLSKGLREKDFKKAISGYLPDDEHAVRIIAGTIKGMTYELVTNCLLTSDLDPHLGVLYRRYNMGLVRDLCYIIEAETVRQTVQFFRLKRWDVYLEGQNGEWALKPAGIKSIAMRFESHQKRVQEIIGCLIDDIFQLMRELAI